MPVYDAQYTSLLQTVSAQLAVDLSTSQLQRLTDAAVGPSARDALHRQRRDTLMQLRDELGKIRDDVRRKSEMIERSENNLLELRYVCMHRHRYARRPDRPHYQCCQSVRSSVCPFVTFNSKTKERRKTDFVNVSPTAANNRCAC